MLLYSPISLEQWAAAKKSVMLLLRCHNLLSGLLANLSLA